nr:RING finger protein [Endozoicomonas sp. YOMI1]
MASLAASSSSISSDDKDVCPICLEEFEKKIVVARCGHAFHHKCIEDWKIASAALAVTYRIHEHVPDCPTCKSELIIDNSSSSEVETADLKPVDIDTPQGKQNTRIRQTLFSAKVQSRGPLVDSSLPLPPDAKAQLDPPIPVTLEASIRNRNLPLAQRLVNDHGAILTADSLKEALEKAAETLNAHQAGLLLELSSSDPASQAVARMVLDNVLQKIIPRALNMSYDRYLQLVNFVKVFLGKGITVPELVNAVMQISVQRSELHLAKEFKSVYGGQLDISTLATALQQSAQQRDAGKAQKLLELVMPDVAVRDIGRKILKEVLQNTLPKAEGMGMIKFGEIMAFTRLFFSHGIVNSALIDTVMRLYILRGMPKKAQEIKAQFGADEADQAVGSSHQANPQLPQPALDKNRLRVQLLEAIQNSNINTVYWLKNQAAMHDIVSPATWQEALNVALDCENPDIVAALLSD